MQLNISNEENTKAEKLFFPSLRSNKSELMYDTRLLKLVHCCPKAVNCQLLLFYPTQNTHSENVLINSHREY